MKIGLDIISAALERMLRKHQSAASAALPLETVVRHWESTRLRASDLVLGIEALHRQGRINLEPRHDGLWLRHRGGSPQASSNNPYERLRESVQQLTLHIALSRVEKRQDDGYSGLDRRLSQQAS